MSPVNAQHSLHPAHAQTSQIPAVPGEEANKQENSLWCSQVTQLHTGFKISIRPVLPYRALFKVSIQPVMPDGTHCSRPFFKFLKWRFPDLYEKPCPESFQIPGLSRMPTPSSLQAVLLNASKQPGCVGLEKGGQDCKIKAHRESSLDGKPSPKIPKIAKFFSLTTSLCGSPPPHPPTH